MSVKKRKKAGPFITGVDVGTSKICVVVSEVTDEGIDIMSITSCPSAGVRKGIVVDVEAASSAIRNALSAAREQSGISTREAVVSISGNHILSTIETVSVAVAGRSVSQDDLDRVMDSAGEIPVVAGREIIHVLPTEFILDGGRGIKDPIGIPATRLEARVNIITASSQPLQRLVLSCEKAGLQVNDLVLQSIAASESALSHEDRDMGTALIDMGGGTTDIALFKDGWLQHAAVLGIGGNHFTNDISVGLKVPFEEAERVKRQFGTVAPLDGDEEIDVVGFDDPVETVRKASRKFAVDIMHLRAEELLDLIRKELARLESLDAVTGAVLTGGCVLMPHFERFAESALSIPVRIGYPDLTSKGTASSQSLPFVTGMKEQYNSPEYAAGIGLVLYAAGYDSASEGSYSDGLLNKMTGFLKNIMGRKR